MKLLLKSIAVTIITLLANTQAHAVAVAVELQLIIDTSGSVDQSEFILQRDGYVAAFQSTTVQNAITTAGGIAVSVGYFATTAIPGAPTDPAGTLMNPQIGWMHLTSAADANAFAGLISALGPTDTEPVASGGTGETNIAQAIQFGVSAFGSNGFEGDRLVIDISTDGVQNTNLDGTPGDAPGCCLLTAALCTDVVSNQRNMATGIAINALAINPDDIDQDIQLPPGVTIEQALMSIGLSPDAGIDDYLNAFVITDGGFVLTASFDTFASAITQKINAEILGIPIPIPAAFWLFGSAIGLLLFRSKQAALT